MTMSLSGWYQSFVFRHSLSFSPVSVKRNHREELSIPWNMAAWCAACLFRLDPICGIQGTAIVGRQVYLGAVIGLAG